MRILAIRGENLASLSDFFEVDFEAEPIQSSGIFAITGPTGAGKTTILDAICLALFDRLPSFDQFRRSVLLAQGDFDTFIKAGSKDRAELLEESPGRGSTP